MHDEGEQLAGFYTMLEEHLDMPFETKVLDVDVVVEGIDLSGAGEIIAICKRGRFRQSISILELPLREPLPRGAEWIEAYRRWALGK